MRPRVRASRRIADSVSASTPPLRVVAGTLSSLLNPEKVKLDDLGSAIETWEEKVRAYEARRGPDGERKEMDDDIKTGALQSMCPESLQTHLSMNSKRFRSYVEVRAEITSYVGQLQQQLASLKGGKAQERRKRWIPALSGE